MRNKCLSIKTCFRQFVNMFRICLSIVKNEVRVIKGNGTSHVKHGYITSRYRSTNIETKIVERYFGNFMPILKMFGSSLRKTAFFRINCGNGLIWDIDINGVTKINGNIPKPQLTPSPVLLWLKHSIKLEKCIGNNWKTQIQKNTRNQGTRSWNWKRLTWIIQLFNQCIINLLV